MLQFGKRLCWTLAFAAIGWCGLSAAEYFSDDFENYVDPVDGLPSDAALIDSGWKPVDENSPIENATWTVTNPGGRLPPPTANGTPSVGLFLISDSDKADRENPTGSGMSHDIWSPIFSCEAAQKVWLHFNCSAQLNNNGRVVFDVDVSIDGGEGWLNVFRRVAPQRFVDPVVTIDNADGVFGRVDIDLTEWAAREPAVMFRIRQFEPNDDWWIAVDDVLVDDVPPPRGEVVILPRQTFSQGIPADWKVISLIESDKRWSTVDECKRSLLNNNRGVFPDPFDGRGLHRLDEAFAIVDSKCALVPQEELLVTPAIDCTQCNQVFLHFKSNIVAHAGSVQEVRVSLDGGQTFEAEPILTFGAGALFDTGEDPFYNEYTFEVPQAVRKNGVAFAFYYQAPGDHWWWAIDDVEVSASGNLNPRSCDNRGFQVAFNPQSGAVTGSWKAITGDQGFRVLQAGRQIGADLPATTLTFTDPTPPVGGVGVTYTLQVLVGGSVESQCVSQEITTFACQAGLDCAVNNESKEVTLTWNKPVNPNAIGYELRRDGEKVATPGLDETRYSERTGPGIFEYELSLVPGPGAHPSQCPTPIACRAIVIGDFIFFDDFEGYSGDADLKAAGWERKEVNTPVEDAAWTITNPGGRFNPPVFDGRPSYGKFIVSDSDNASSENPTGSGMSHDLWSPPIDGAGKNAVWLHMDVSAQLNNNGKCAFDVDVSTDDGQNWENVFRRVAPARNDFEPLVTTGNADGFFGRLDLDLTALVAQKPSFRFRLRHFEPNDDWWIAVDNVLVDEVPVTGGKTVVLPRETFTDGIPGSWTVESRIGGVANWSTDDLCSRSLIKAGLGFPDGFDGRGLHRLDEWFALVDSNCAAADQDEILATPVLDCSALKQVYLHVKSDIVVTDSAVQEILLSLDGGKTFEKSPVFSYNGGGLFDSGEDPFYNEYILSVPRAAGKDRVVFAFHYRSATGQARFWAVDDVMVTGDSAVVLPVFHRGDTNSDSSLDLSDAVFILSFLFLGGPSPTCAETGDGNDDGAVDISDGVYLLTYQFLGGPPPASPGPPGSPCGPDREGSPKDLGCESYPGC